MTSRTTRTVVAAFLGAALLLGGCTAKQAGKPAESSNSAAKPAAIKIGTLATQDALPLWVAEQKGHFKEAGLPSVEIVTFQSAQEEQVAFVSGAVDALMTDLIVSSNLQSSGTPVRIATIMLGADTAQGRFAIVAAPNSGITDIKQLKGVPVGTSSATITEYVLDNLMTEAGVAATDVKKEEVKKMPVRYELLMAGKLKAAVLPEPFITLALKNGASIPAGGDDTKAASNVSQSVLAVSRKFSDTLEGAASVDALLKAWDKAVADINADPQAYRQTLVDKARLPKPLADTYQVGSYPTAVLPTTEQVQSVIDWMKAAGYLKAEVTPEQLLKK